MLFLTLFDRIIKASDGCEDRKLFTLALPYVEVQVLYFDGLVRHADVGLLLLEPLRADPVLSATRSAAELTDLLTVNLLGIPLEPCRDRQAALTALLRGAVLLWAEKEVCLIAELTGYTARSVDAPSEENVSKGARDSFVEALRFNTATLRAHVRSTDLKTERFYLGTRSSTPVDLVYYGGIASPSLVEDMRRRIRCADTDNALTASAVEEALFPKRLLLPTVLYTERPDKLAADLLEGSVALLVDGLPFAFVLPCTLLRCMQAPEDYSKKSAVASVFRLLRFVMLAVTLIMPAFYVAVTMHHPEMIPRELAVSIEASKQGVPFSTLGEVLILLLALEVLIEAGLRLPKSFGSAISIVGAVVVGQATVTAKIISPAVVVVIAATALASYTVPNQDLANALRLWRAALVFAAAFLGLSGLLLALCVLITVWCRAESCGVPFLSSLSPSCPDGFFRLPMRLHRTRPRELDPVDKARRTK